MVATNLFFKFVFSIFHLFRFLFGRSYIPNKGPSTWCRYHVGCGSIMSLYLVHVSACSFAVSQTSDLVLLVRFFLIVYFYFKTTKVRFFLNWRLEAERQTCNV